MWIWLIDKICIINNKRKENNINEGKEKRVIDRIKVAADNGGADSPFILATMYDALVEYRNKKQSFKYYTLAAQNGIAEAQYRLEDIYYYNKDLIFVDENFELAFKYYNFATDNEYAHAQYKIALIYENGVRKYDYKSGKTSVIIAENRETTFKYYKLAAENGITEVFMRVLEICKDTNKPKVFKKYYMLASNSKNEDTRIYANYLS